MNEWVVTKLKDVCEKVTVGYVGAMADQYVISGVPFLRSLNIRPYRVSLEKLMFISEAFDRKIKKSALRPGDVAIVRTGYPGVACVIPKSLPHSNCSDLVIVRPAKGLNPHFLCAIFNSTFGRDVVAGNLVGAAQQHFNITVAKELKFQIPDRLVQDKIAAVLVAYDDLIENNRQRIALLERMAEQLYREWFVRFRFPGHELAKFEKGLPVGWDTALASKFFGYVRGKSYASDDLSEDPEQVPFITLKSFNRGGGYRADGLKRFSGRHKPDQLVRQNDIVMAVTDMTQGREVIGRVARVPDFGEQGAVISMDVIKLVPKTISASFLYSYMRLSGFGEFIKEFANGTNVLHLKPDLVTKQRIAMPPKDLREHFSAIIEPIFEQIDVLSKSIAPLEESRNLLLPRLISGKLSVDDLDIRFPPSMQEAAA